MAYVVGDAASAPVSVDHGAGLFSAGGYAVWTETPPHRRWSWRASTGEPPARSEDGGFFAPNGEGLAVASSGLDYVLRDLETGDEQPLSFAPNHHPFLASGCLLVLRNFDDTAAAFTAYDLCDTDAAEVAIPVYLSPLDGGHAGGYAVGISVETYEVTSVDASGMVVASFGRADTLVATDDGWVGWIVEEDFDNWVYVARPDGTETRRVAMPGDFRLDWTINMLQLSGQVMAWSALIDGETRVFAWEHGTTNPVRMLDDVLEDDCFPWFGVVRSQVLWGCDGVSDPFADGVAQEATMWMWDARTPSTPAVVVSGGDDFGWFPVTRGGLAAWRAFDGPWVHIP